MATNYHDWYIRADEAWTQYSNYLEQHEKMMKDPDVDPEEMSMVHTELFSWKAAAEHAENQMAEIEKCLAYPFCCEPAQSLMLPL